MTVATCLICKKEFSFAGYRHHLFAGVHANDIINSIHLKKKSYTAYLAKFDANPQSIPFPKLYLTKQANLSHDFCYPCKKIRDVRTNRPIECVETHKKASAEFIRECLAKEPTIPIVEEAPKPSIDEAALKRENTRLKALLEASSGAVERDDTFYDLLSFFYENDEHIFKRLMDEIKRIEPSVYQHFKKELDLED
jgi:hypothetical protein